MLSSAQKSNSLVTVRIFPTVFSMYRIIDSPVCLRFQKVVAFATVGGYKWDVQALQEAKQDIKRLVSFFSKGLQMRISKQTA